ncbi:MAG: quinolinate synthase NadA [Rhodobiaceae bacterium]|jgi:quinolinate synthase|nr:quinolinate synthase NadA [Rhodobiaceae bacterium]MBT5518517.1 quinolinate synthase NadA [Rhodobiaceae bacterium]MBT7279737.1 quinolinate synthase NadA [Rhodobiaceae bacterium]
MANLSDALLTEAKTALPGQTGARILEEMDIAYSDGMARDMAPLYERVKSVIPSVEWPFFAPYIQAINEVKRQRNAVILAHNYQTPEIFHGVADVVGDSLQLAIEAAKAEGDVIVQCGVHFMAETSKLLNPEKTVLIPDMGAGCSLADSITAQDVRALREAYPGVPIVTYVNTSAAVKAESDVCCTSSNAVKIVNGMGTDRVLCIPDEYLAQNIAREADVEVIAWKGRCEVHEQFSAEELQQYRADDPGLRIIAHPECKPDVLDEADFSGSTSAMIKWVTDNQPDRVMMVTECSMSDNVAVENPNVNFVRPCNLCPHMKQITLPKVLEALVYNRTEITVDAAIAGKARAAVERMIELSK